MGDELRVYRGCVYSVFQQYALHLAAQTKRLSRERKRADWLLFQMLPKTVVDQLKKNQSVTAEAFDVTTVFFSDIVGFTCERR